MDVILPILLIVLVVLGKLFVIWFISEIMKE